VREGKVGLLLRRPVMVGTIALIGKESNRLEERSRGELSTWLQGVVARSSTSFSDGFR
jgi:hypothetical protein